MWLTTILRQLTDTFAGFLPTARYLTAVALVSYLLLDRSHSWYPAHHQTFVLVQGTHTPQVIRHARRTKRFNRSGGWRVFCLPSFLAAARLTWSLGSKKALMSVIHSDIESLLARIATQSDADIPAEFLPRLSVTAVGTAAHLDFYGEPFSEAFTDLLETLSKPDVAACVQSLTLRGPDEGANGTKNWNIEPLLANDVAFPQLDSFTIQLAQPGDHNRSIVADTYDEDGVIARLVKQSPQIRHLTVPSAPNAEFFKTGIRPLQFLSVDAGYNTQEFISNLSVSDSFPELRCLEWGEYNETYMENWQTSCTPFADYDRLFRSAAFASVKRFVWRNPVCSAQQINELKGFRPDLQLLVVRYESEYV